MAALLAGRDLETLRVGRWCLLDSTGSDSVEILDSNAFSQLVWLMTEETISAAVRWDTSTGWEISTLVRSVEDPLSCFERWASLRKVLKMDRGGRLSSERSVGLAMKPLPELGFFRWEKRDWLWSLVGYSEVRRDMAAR